MPRSSSDSDRIAVVGSAVLHAGVVILVFLSTALRPEPLEYLTYEVEIVSPPSSVQAEVAETAPPEPELEVETPDPARLEEPEPEPEPVVEEETVPQPERRPEPEPERETRTEPEPERKEPAETKPATPDPEPSELSGEDIEVRMEGLRRDFPAYYGNIIRQIQRCFRPPEGARGEAVVQFFINRDGSVSDIDLVQRSGSINLDLEGVNAVDCAGRGRLGPLPEDLRLDRLPVRFRFTPSGRDEPSGPVP